MLLLLSSSPVNIDSFSIADEGEGKLLDHAGKVNPIRDMTREEAHDVKMRKRISRS